MDHAIIYLNQVMLRIYQLQLVIEFTSVEGKKEQLDEFIHYPEPTFSAVNIANRKCSNSSADDELDQFYMGN